MLNDWRVRRRLQRAVNNARAKFQTDYQAGERNVQDLLKLQREVNFHESLLLKFKSTQLIEKAQRYGVEAPLTAGWWADDSESGLPPEDVTRWLTQAGQAGLKDLIIEKRKKNWEFWIRVIVALTGLGGTIRGIISVLKK